MPGTSTIDPIVTLDEATHVYTHRDGFHPPSVTQILASVPPWLGRFDHVDADQLNYKRTLGTQVHRATHYYDEGDLGQPIDPILAPYLAAWIRFRAEKRFTPTLMETAVFHPAHGYAGTFDRLGVTDTLAKPTPVLLDLKTGDGSMAGPQLAAYLAAWTAMQAQALQGPAATPTARWTVQLHESGLYTLTVHTSRRDWPVFLAAFELFTYTRPKEPPMSVTPLHIRFEDPEPPPDPPMPDEQDALDREVPAVVIGEIVPEPDALIPGEAILRRMEGITAADRAKALVLGQRALALVAITSDDDEVLAGDLIDALTTHQAHIERKVRPFADLAFKLHRSLTGFLGQATQELTAGLTHLRPMLAKRLRAKQEAEEARQRKALGKRHGRPSRIGCSPKRRMPSRWASPRHWCSSSWRKPPR
jgi:hypothetical protein